MVTIWFSIPSLSLSPSVHTQDILLLLWANHFYKIITKQEICKPHTFLKKNKSFPNNLSKENSFNVSFIIAYPKTFASGCFDDIY